MTDSMESRSGRLSSLTIAGFRGFREPITLDFDASAVLMSGPNGTGKTSVFDALQWLLVGDVARLTSYKLRRNEEYLANVYQATVPALVEAHFRLPGTTLQVKRTGNSSDSNLEVSLGTETHTGSGAARVLQHSLIGGDLPLSEVLATNGLLQQDDLRQLLQTKPDLRYRQLLRLLGLEVLELFDRYAATGRDASRRATRTARENVDLLRPQVEAVAERLETARLQVQLQGTQELDTSAITAVVISVVNVLELTDTPDSPEQLAAFAASLRSSEGQIRAVRSQLGALPDALPPNPESSLGLLATQLSDAQLSLERERQRQTEAQQALRAASSVQDAISRLAAAAIPLLPVDQEMAPCPVCQTNISPSQVVAEIEARAATAAAQAAAQALVEASDEAVRAADESVQRLRTEERALRTQASERRDRAEALRQALQAADRWRAGVASPFLRVAASLASGLESVTAPLRVTSDPAEDADGRLFASWLDTREDTLGILESLASALGAVADAADISAAAATAAKLATDRAAALPRLQAEYDELRIRLEHQEVHYEEARRTETAATVLAQSSTAAATEIFRERFDALEPLINDIYARLDPHPAFTQLGIRVETYRSKGTATPNVIDVDEHVDANPMIVFSSAQANIVVLAAFLALGWAAGDRGLPFVLLDDPLQALDDVNVLGFADLARRLRRQRQLVLATHEERFAELLQRKLTGRAEGEDLIIHRFVGWNRNGPLIETQRISPRPDLQLRILAS
jgi:DNA repair exonuclease SbcCD ATPase subunit